MGRKIPQQFDDFPSYIINVIYDYTSRGCPIKKKPCEATIFFDDSANTTSSRRALWSGRRNNLGFSKVSPSGNLTLCHGKIMNVVH
jgi:hypothetical protein